MHPKCIKERKQKHLWAMGTDGNTGTGKPGGSADSRWSGYIPMAPITCQMFHKANTWPKRFCKCGVFKKKIKIKKAKQKKKGRSKKKKVHTCKKKKNSVLI